MTDQEGPESGVVISCTGFVAAVDALGVRHVSDSPSFIRAWAELTKDLRRNGPDPTDPDLRATYHAMLMNEAEEAVPNATGYVVSDPGKSGPGLLTSRHVLGDTVTVATAPASRPGLFLLTSFLADLFLKALRKGIKLRGAISYGEYWTSRHMLVGPAGSDAFDWHDRTDWIGIALTSTAGLVYEKIAKPEDVEHDVFSLLRFPVPLRREGSLSPVPLHTLDWTRRGGAISRGEVVDLFTKEPIPVIGNPSRIGPSIARAG